MTANCNFHEKVIISQLNGGHLEFEGFSYLEICKCVLVHVTNPYSSTIKQLGAYKWLHFNISFFSGHLDFGGHFGYFPFISHFVTGSGWIRHPLKWLYPKFRIFCIKPTMGTLFLTKSWKKSCLKGHFRVCCIILRFFLTPSRSAQKCL